MPNSSDAASTDSVPQDAATLEGFVQDILGDNSFRVARDFGLGYVELKASEADRRQAAQDIQSVEDIVVELLRNSRDAGAKNIMLATIKHANIRSIIVIDDGCGIPEIMHENIFKPRVTSKLNSAHMDSWGMHGRGMALYSIKERSKSSRICKSSPDNGCAIRIDVDLNQIPEKRDQSTFPYFEIIDSAHAMRGPKNILRTVAEFALTHKDTLNIYCGSPSEVCATLLKLGDQAIPPKDRIFNNKSINAKITELLSLSPSVEDFTDTADTLGLELSQRSSRRILDGEIAPLTSMVDRIKNESFPANSERSQVDFNKMHNRIDIDLHTDMTRLPRISNDDIDQLKEKYKSVFNEIADKYYLNSSNVNIVQRNKKVIIEIDITDKE